MNDRKKEKTDEGTEKTDFYDVFSFSFSFSIFEKIVDKSTQATRTQQTLSNTLSHTHHTHTRTQTHSHTHAHTNTHTRTHTHTHPHTIQHEDKPYRVLNLSSSPRYLSSLRPFKQSVLARPNSFSMIQEAALLPKYAPEIM